jgi:hypothetical protein
MTRIQKCIVFLGAFLLIANGVSYTALADQERRKERRRYQEKYRNQSGHHGKEELTPVNNPTYREVCGACHFAYQPELLPSASWQKILDGLEDHFGEAIGLDPDSRKIIAEYVEANAAEHSSAKRAVEIMRCLGTRTPLRITEIPYIQRKHHEVSPKVLKRDSIGSLSNCSACHTTAEKGIYDDDYVVIPR